MSARADAIQIWQAAVDAVDSDRLVRQNVTVDSGRLRVGDQEWSLDSLRRIVVVGAGKAGAGMAAGLEAALGPVVLEDKQVRGWINVPAGCERPLQRVTLHAARPAGCNEPTAEGVIGTERILELVSALDERDLIVWLLSGGGSALLPAPCEGIQLNDLLQVTQVLSSSGATIQQLNAVRKRLSRIQGGQLALACQKRRVPLVSLIISDVMGDPLDVIASGPTVLPTDELSAAQVALDVFDHFDLLGQGIRSSVRVHLESDRDRLQRRTAREASTIDRLAATVHNFVIGNNQVAVAAAAKAATQLGYTVTIADGQAADATAEAIGTECASQLTRADRRRTRACWISGGEPVVKLVPTDQRGKGGRNQQLVLTAVTHLLNARVPALDWAILSGGTDGEDGPTDAAGAVADQPLLEACRQASLDAASYLRRNDAYPFFQSLGGLIQTGPTHTNVCDVRVVVIRSE